MRQEVDPGGGGSNRTGDRRQLGNFRFDRPRSVGASVSVVVLDLVKLEPGGAKLASDPGVLRLDVILKSVMLKSCLIRPLIDKMFVGLDDVVHIKLFFLPYFISLEIFCIQMSFLGLMGPDTKEAEIINWRDENLGNPSYTAHAVSSV